MNSPRLRKFLGVSILVFVVLAALVFLFYTIENRRGARAWEATRGFLEEKGVTLDPSELWPAPVSPDENFCAIPLLASLTDFEPVTETRTLQPIEFRHPKLQERFSRMALPSPSYYQPVQPHTPNYLDQSLFEAAPWARYLRKLNQFDPIDPDDPPLTQIKTAFASFEPDLTEIANAAATRPLAQFPIQHSPVFHEDYFASSMHLRDAEDFARFLTLQGATALSAGDLEKAKQCLAIQLKFVHAAEIEPGLLHQFLATHLFHMAMNLTWEGLRIRAWDDADLIWIGDRLQSINFLESGARAIRAELISFRRTTETMRSRDSSFWNFHIRFPNDAQVLQKIARRMPEGWLDQNAAHGCRSLHDDWLVPFEKGEYSRLLLEVEGQTDPALYPYTFIAEVYIPPRHIFMNRTVHSETMLRAARIACALERFHLRNQAYPENLDSLIPDFMAAIPADLITGKPLTYRRAGNPGGRYRIYSVGPNREDDGGAVVKIDDRYSRQTRWFWGRTDLSQGDWVWTFPPEEAG